MGRMRYDLYFIFPADTHCDTKADIWRSGYRLGIYYLHYPIYRRTPAFLPWHYRAIHSKNIYGNKASPTLHYFWSKCDWARPERTSMKGMAAKTLVSLVVVILIYVLSKFFVLKVKILFPKNQQAVEIISVIRLLFFNSILFTENPFVRSHPKINRRKIRKRKRV